jgi:hypothetical protein
MNAQSILASTILCAAALAPAAQARPPVQLASPEADSSAPLDGAQVGTSMAGETLTASGPKKLLDTYMASSFVAMPLFPGFNVVDTSAVNCPGNASSCTIGLESMVQIDSLSDVFAICLKVDSMAPSCHNQTAATSAFPTIGHAREAFENLAPGPHIVQTLMKMGNPNGNTLFSFHTDYRVYKP